MKERTVALLILALTGVVVVAVLALASREGRAIPADNGARHHRGVTVGEWEQMPPLEKIVASMELVGPRIQSGIYYSDAVEYLIHHVDRACPEHTPDTLILDVMRPILVEHGPTYDRIAQLGHGEAPSDWVDW